MELLFESRMNLNASGKLHFFQAKPTIHPVPVLEPDSFVDGAGANLYGTVIHDQGIYRMWYQGTPQNWDSENMQNICYAESDNGIEWRKPKLGLVDYAGRGKNNNLINISGHSMNVFIDPNASPSHRYRATLCSHGQSNIHGFYTAHSADGIFWEYDKNIPQWNHADVITSIYHPCQNRAVVMLKINPLQTINGMRRRAFLSSELINGQWSTETHAALIPDEFDDIAANARGYASGDYYGVSMMPAGAGTVGFLWQFRHDLPYPVGDIVQGLFGVVDITLCYQAKRGDKWLHAHGRPDFISHNDPSWGGGCIFTSSCPIEVGDEQWLYFSATPFTHGCYVNEKWEVLENVKKSIMDAGNGRIGFMRWPKWRLFGVGSDSGGTLEINLGRLKNNSNLFLNYRCKPGGSIKVETVYGTFTDPEKRSGIKSLPLTGDSLSEQVMWQEGSSIKADTNTDCIARLHLVDAEVYAYDVIAEQ